MWRLLLDLYVNPEIFYVIKSSIHTVILADLRIAFSNRILA